MSRSTLIAIALALAAIVNGALPAMAQDPKRQERTITLSATGSASAVPDFATIMVGVMTEGDTANVALAANTKAMRQVVDTLKSRGLASKDLQTSDFSVQPRYEYKQDGTPPKINGYQVMNTLHIRVRELGSLGEILDEVVQVGSNQINGIQFGVTKADELTDAARREAVTKATRRAKLYTEAAGVTLGPVLRIEEQAFNSGPRPLMATKAIAAESAVPIEAGEQSLEIAVTMTWTIE